MFKILILCVAIFAQVRSQTCESSGLQDSGGPSIGGMCPDSSQVAVGDHCCLPPNGGTTGSLTTPSPSGSSGSSGPLAPGCSGPCIGNLCPSGLTCNTGTQQCCSSTTGGTISGPGTTTCMDKVGPDGVSDCPALAYLCNNPIYNNLMTNQCPRTCNKCTSTGTIGGIPGTTGTTGLGLTCNTANQECCSSTTGGTVPGSTNCVDKTNPQTGRSDCPELSYLCSSSVYKTVMTQQCPRTSGLQDAGGPSVGGMCPDSSQVAIGDHCCLPQSSGTTGSLTTPSPSGSAAPGCVGPCIGNICPSGLTCSAAQQCCSSTTGGVVPAPSTTTCVDKVGPSGVSDCPALANLCDSPVYYNVMTNQCPKTCNRCTSTGITGTTRTPGTSGSTGSTTCVDKINPKTGTSDCPALSSLCSNTKYKTVMTQQCPKTCGLCGASSGTIIS
ncbi:hypothetical protein FO519_008506 [Halicephalobus sp. NKZ332]|nr:hypothetical protein FO519_008506 [Halicephalobus sp. NKZ332]